jgi:hypothetical protein
MRSPLAVLGIVIPLFELLAGPSEASARAEMFLFPLETSSPALASVSVHSRSSISQKRFIPMPCPSLP